MMVLAYYFILEHALHVVINEIREQLLMSLSVPFLGADTLILENQVK